MLDLQLHKDAEEESAEVGKKLAKVAEQKLKNISTSLELYKKKNKEEFPIKSAKKYKYIEGKGLFSSAQKEEIGSIDLTDKTDKLGRIKLSKIQVGTYFDGSPMETSFDFHIVNDRFVRCDSTYKEDFFKSFKVPKPSAIKENKDNYGNPYTGIPERYCHTMTSPMKVYLLPNLYGMSYESDYLRKEVYVELKSDDLAKAKKIIEKKKDYESRLNANIWLAANEIIDELQSSMIKATRESASQVDKAEAYLNSQEIKKFAL